MSETTMKNSVTLHADQTGLQATAYHEAGHAVVSIALGLAIDRVSIIPADDGSLGRCLKPGVLGYRCETKREMRTIARELILSLYAGMHAERLIDPEAPEYHGDSDENEAFELSRRYEVFPRFFDWVGDDRHQAYLDRLRNESRRLVRKHRDAIGRFATLLLQRKEVGRSEAEQLIKPLLG